MSLEADPSTETVDTSTETPDVSDGAGASAGAGGAVAESTPTAEPSEAGSADVVDELVSWKGTPEALAELPGWNDLSPAAQKAIEAKLQDIQTGWQRKYVAKAGEFRSKEEAFQAREAEIAAQEKKVMGYLYGDGDPLQEARAQIDQLKAEMEVQKAAIRSEYEEAVNKIRSSSGEEMQKAVQERDEALQKLRAYEERQNAVIEAEAEKRADELESFIKEQAPALAENDALFEDWIALMQKGRSPEDAYNRLRLFHDDLAELGAVKAEGEGGKDDAPAAEEPAPEPPKAVKTMSMGGGAAGTKAGERRSLDDILLEMRKTAGVSHRVP